ncbi:uncharacterized protein LOC118189104 [Stegodyphus dumicola]|uniref:uncharacterized protein LOC118189104 n=1 Tax=Stegodyphus dumicola TaxID=202533 RepID=UPI0015ADE03F|nr:uncharacterized protein LOC118189104 [Stegodyphus dumicola]
MNSSRHLSTLLQAVLFSAILCRGENPKFKLLTDAMNCSLTHRMKENGRNGILSMLGGSEIAKCSIEVDVRNGFLSKLGYANIAVYYIGVNSPVDGKNSNAEYVGYFRITDISVMYINGMNETDSSIFDVQITVTRNSLTRRILVFVLVAVLPIFLNVILFIFVKCIKQVVCKQTVSKLKVATCSSQTRLV